MSEWTDYFSGMIKREDQFPELPLREKRCGSCAVECGLYTEISQALKLEPPDIQLKVSKKWFCHDGDGACRGNAELVGIEWESP